MKSIRIDLEDKEYKEIKAVKNQLKMTWHKLFMLLLFLQNKQELKREM